MLLLLLREEETGAGSALGVDFSGRGPEGMGGLEVVRVGKLESLFALSDGGGGLRLHIR